MTIEARVAAPPSTHTTTPASAPVAPARKKRAPNGHAAKEHWFPLYGQEMLEGDFADENDVFSMTLFLILRNRANICGIADFVVNSDEEVYSKWMTKDQARVAMDRLFANRSIIYDPERGAAFIRSFLKWDRMVNRTSNNFKAFAKNARNIGSKPIRRALAMSLANEEQGIRQPDGVKDLAKELIHELLGREAEEILRRSTVASDAEWSRGA